MSNLQPTAVARTQSFARILVGNGHIGADGQHIGNGRNGVNGVVSFALLETVLLGSAAEAKASKSASDGGLCAR